MDVKARDNFDAKKEAELVSNLAKQYFEQSSPESRNIAKIPLSKTVAELASTEVKETAKEVNNAYAAAKSKDGLPYVTLITEDGKATGRVLGVNIKESKSGQIPSTMEANFIRYRPESTDY
jgi:hypothetical protein